MADNPYAGLIVPEDLTRVKGQQQPTPQQQQQQPAPQQKSLGAGVMRLPEPQAPSERSGPFMRGVEQLGAGMLEMILPPPIMEGEETTWRNYVPGAAYDVYNMIGLLGMGTGAYDLPGFEDSMRLRANSSEAANRIVGTTDPTNYAEMGVRTMAPLAAPLKVPGAIAKLPKAARIPTQLAYEATVPFNNATTTAGKVAVAGAGAGVGVGVGEVIDHYLPSDEYTSLADVLSNPANAAEPVPGADKGTGGLSQNDPYAGLFASETTPTTNANSDPYAGLIETVTDSPSVNPYEGLIQQDTPTGTNELAVREAANQDAMEKLGLMAAAMIGTPIVMKKVADMYIAKKREKAFNLEDIPEAERLTTLDAIDQELADDTVGLTRVYERQIGDDPDGKESLANFDARRELSKGISLQTITNTMMEYGSLPWRNVTGRAKNIKFHRGHNQFVREIEAKLTPEQKANFYRALEIRDEIDTRQQALRVNMAANQKAKKPRDLDPETLRTRFLDTDMNTLKQELRQLEMDDAIRRFGNEYRAFNQTFARWMAGTDDMSGYINQKQLSDLTKAHPNYVPRYLPRGNSIFDKARNALGSDTQVSDDGFLRPREYDPGKLPTAEPKYMDPIAAQRRYMAEAVRTIARNRVQREFIQLMKQRGHDFNERAYPPDPKFAGQWTEVRQTDGSSRWYEFRDPWLKQAFEQNPRIQNGIFNWTRNIFQRTTTGYYNPFFAPVSLMYEALMAPMVGGKVGYLSRIPGWDNSWASRNIPDVTAPLMAAEGAVRGVWDSMKESAYRAVSQSIDKNGYLSRMLEAAGVDPDVLSQRLARSWTNSVLFAMHRTGGAPSRYNIDMDFERYGAELDTDSVAWHMYKSMHDSIQNGMRYAYFRNNMRDGMTAREMDRLAVETKRLTGDFTIRGSNQTVGRITNAVPYANVTLQATRRYAQIAMANPSLFASGLMATTMTPLTVTMLSASLAGPEYEDYYWRQLSWTDRLSYAYYFTPDRAPQDAFRFRILPESSIFAGPFITLMDSVFGFSEGVPRQYNPGVFTAILDSVTGAGDRLFSPAMPPLIEGGLGMLGYRISPDGIASGGIQEIYETHTNEGRMLVDDVLFHNQVEAVLGSFVNITGRMVLDFGRALDRGWRGQEGDDLADTVGVVGDAAWGVFERQSDQVPGGATFLGLERRKGKWNEDQAVFQRKYDALQQLKQAADKYVRGGFGQTGLGASIPTGQMDAGFETTPQAQQVMAASVNVFNNIAQQKQQINSLLRRRDALDFSTRISRDDKVKQFNALQDQVMMARSNLVDQIRQFEQAMSQQLGQDFTVEDFLSQLP